MHEIQLRRPWSRISKMDQQPVVVDVPDSTVMIESRVLSGDQVRYQRGFNSPTGLSAADKVGLFISGWQGQLVSVQINETVFSPGDAPVVLDLSRILMGFNNIEIRLMSKSGELPRITGDVVLQIQEESI